MRKIFLWLLLTAPCLAQYPYVPAFQWNANSSSGNNTTCAMLSNVASGNIGVAFGSQETTAATAATDTLTSTWANKLSNSSFTDKVTVWTTTYGSSGANTISLTGGGSFLDVACAEIPSDVMTTTVDASAVNHWTSSTATLTAPNVTTTKNYDVVFTCFGNDNSNKPLYLAAADLSKAWPLGAHYGADGIACFVSIAGLAGTFTGITVQNPSSEATGTAFTIAFQAPTLAFKSPKTLPDGVINTAYSYNLLAMGGAGAYTWSITAGSLPSGLSLNSSTGAITGTIGAGASNNYTLTFHVTDGTNSADLTNATIKVGASGNIPAFIQGKGSASNVSSLAFTSNVTSGSMIHVNMGWFNTGAGVGKCTDSLGTTYRPVADVLITSNSAGNPAVDVIAAGVAPSGGADTVSCSSVTQISESSGLNFVAADNTLANIATSGTSQTTGSLTTLVPNEMLVMACAARQNNTTETVNSPFTQVESAVSNSYKLGYDATTTVTGYSGSCTGGLSDQWATNLVGFRPSAGAVVITGTGGPCLFMICQ